jgi:hypothetical protein
MVPGLAGAMERKTNLNTIFDPWKKKNEKIIL